MFPHQKQLLFATSVVVLVASGTTKASTLCDEYTLRSGGVGPTLDSRRDVDCGDDEGCCAVHGHISIEKKVNCCSTLVYYLYNTLISNSILKAILEL